MKPYNLIENKDFNFYTKYFIILVFLVYFLLNINIIEGDPTILLAFTKHFFESPFSFGSPERITFGATSPVFLVLTAVFYKVFTLKYFLIPFKLFNIFLLIIAIINFRKILFILNERLKLNLNHRNIESSIFIFLGINFFIFDEGIRIYESFVSFFFISYVLLLLVKEKNIISLVLFSGLGYLIRPELLPIQFLVYLYVLYKLRSKGIIYILLSTIPIILYHSYMYYHTNEIIPDTVVSRSIRFYDVELWKSYFIIVYKSPEVLLTFLLSGLTALYFISKNKWKSKYIIVFFIFLAMASYIILFKKSFSARYLTIPFLICAPITILYISSLKRYRFILIAAICFILANKFLNPMYPNNSTIENRLAEKFAEKINAIIPKSEKIAIYEIEIQYFINSRVVSMDGRVGPEFLPMLARKENFVQVLEKNNINYFSIDNMISSALRNDKFIGYLYKNTDTFKTNDTIKIDGKKFIKIFDKDDAPEEYKMYGDIYKYVRE